MAISQNFPNQLPALSLNFAGSKLLDPRITFTRSSSATYVDDDGLIKTASADVPRFEHNPVTGECLGLLVEESRTNYHLHSENLSVWNTETGATVTSNAYISPDGTQTADALNGTMDGSSAYLITNLFNATTYTFSVFLKYISGVPNIEIQIGDAPFSRSNTTFNVQTGTLVSNTGGTATVNSIQNYGNGWYRYSITRTTAASGGGFMDINHRTTTPSTVAVWGAQIEIGTFASSYIPTSSLGVTRSQDFAEMTGSNFSSWYTATEGTLYTEYSFNGVNGFYNNPVVMLNNGTETYSILITASDAYGVVNHPSALGGVSFIGTVGGTTSPGVTYKSALAFKLDDFAFTLNGLTPVTDFAGPVPTVDRMYIGRRVTLDSSLHGPIKRLVYYPVKFTNSEIQSLTK